MAFGVTSLFGIESYGTGYVQGSSRKKTAELSTVRNQLGVTKCVTLKPLVKVEVSIKGKGDGGLGSMAAESLTATSTISVRSRKRTETNSEVPDFDISGVSYENLDYSNFASALTATPDEGIEVGEGCPLLGIVSCGLTKVETFEIEEKVSGVGDVVLNTDGTFALQQTFDPMFEFSVKGKGAIPAALLLGSDGTMNSTVAEFDAGITVVTEIEETQENENESSWSASGSNFPGAV